MEEGRAAAALEAALLLGARAIANRDGEFGRELCRRAGAAIFDPRICAMMGECDELGGDTLEAICAYRAALTHGHVCVLAAVAHSKRKQGGAVAAHSRVPPLRLVGRHLH